MGHPLLNIIYYRWACRREGRRAGAVRARKNSMPRHCSDSWKLLLTASRPSPSPPRSTPAAARRSSPPPWCCTSCASCRPSARSRATSRSRSSEDWRRGLLAVHCKQTLAAWAATCRCEASSARAVACVCMRSLLFVCRTAPHMHASCVPLHALSLRPPSCPRYPALWHFARAAHRSVGHHHVPASLTACGGPPPDPPLPMKQPSSCGSFQCKVQCASLWGIGVQWQRAGVAAVAAACPLGGRAKKQRRTLEGRCGIGRHKSERSAVFLPAPQPLQLSSPPTSESWSVAHARSSGSHAGTWRRQ